MRERIQYWLGPRRPWLWILLALLLYTLGGFLLAPWLVERQLVNLSAERADLSTTVENIDINPYTFTFTMDGLNVSDSQSEPLVALERLFINFELGSIVRRAWTFDEFHVIGLDVAVERFSDGDTNLGVIADRWASTAPPDEGEPEPAQEEPGGVVRLVIADLLVDAASLSLVDNVPATRFATRVDPINFTVQNLSTLPEDNAGQDLTLTLGDGAVLTWSGTSSLNPLWSEGRITLQGPYPALAHEYLQDQLPFELSGGMLSAGLDYRAGDDPNGALSVALTDIQVSVMDTELSELDDGGTLVRLPEIGLDDGELHWPANTVQLGAVRMRGFEFHPERAQDGTINFLRLIEEMVPASGEPAAVEPDAGGAVGEMQPWRIEVGELALTDWQVMFEDRVPEQGAELGLTLGATLANISSAPDTEMQLDSSLEVASGGALSLGGTLVALPQLKFDGNLSLDGLELNVLQPYIQPFARVSLEQGRLGMDGSVNVSPESQTFRGSLSLNELAITDQIENSALFGIERLQLDGIALQQGAESRLDIDEVRLESPYARVEIREDGSTNIGEVLVTSGVTDAPDATVNDVVSGDAGDPGSEAAPPAMAVSVDRVFVDAARADFADWALPLPFSVAISELGGGLSSLSTQSQQPAEIDLEGRVGEFGQVTIGGALMPLAIEEQTQVDLVFRNIDMPSMSPYVIRFAGREIDDGRLDIDLSYRIEDAQMAGENVVVMRDLVLGERVPHPEAADLPLGIAVALLKDSNGVINLDVPVSGDVNNPEFSLGRVIGGAITNVLTNIATAPFRFLSNLVGFEGEDLAVIEFAPGRSDVAPPQREKLASLVEALQQRPQLQLRVPPVQAPEPDRGALAEQRLDQRIEERIVALQDGAAGEMTATRRRIIALEGLMAEEGLAVESSAAEEEDVETDSSGDDAVSFVLLRLMHMAPAVEGEEARLDEPAYTSALRDSLLAQQRIEPAELDALARRRAEQVLSVIRETADGLESRIGLAEPQPGDVNDEGQVGMTLEVEANLGAD